MMMVSASLLAACSSEDKQTPLFKDADLIGFPLKIVVGKGAADGIVEMKDRKTGDSTEVKVEDVLQYVKKFMEG